MDSVLGEELKLKRRFDFPNFSRSVCRQVLPLEEQSQATASTSQDKTVTSQSQGKEKSRERGSSSRPPTSYNTKRNHLGPSTKCPESSNVNRIRRHVVTRSPGPPVDKASFCLPIIFGLIELSLVSKSDQR